MLTKIAFATALVIGSISATQAANTGNASETARHARASYAQAHVQPSPEVNQNAIGAVQPFQKSWFNWQDQE